MDLNQKLKKIDIEIQQGLKMKAADRLRSLINQYPNELVIWDKLASLYYQGGFLDAAGKFWILSDPKSEEIKNCIDLYEKSVNYSGTKILNDIKFRGKANKLPKYAREKLLALQNDSKEKSNYIPTFAPKLNRSQKNSQHQTLFDKILPPIMLSLFLIFIILSIIGLVTVIDKIF